MIDNVCVGVILHCMLETWDSNPYSLGPKPTALPVKLVSIYIITYINKVGYNYFAYQET